MDMPGSSDGHRRRRWRPALLAGSTAVAVAALGGATNIATSLLPRTWAWTHEAVIIWGIVGVLLFLTVVLAMTGARRDTRYVSDAAGRQIHGDVAGNAGAVVVTGSGPVFIGQWAPASTSAPRSPGGTSPGAGQVLAGEIPARPVAFLKRQAVAELAGAWDAGARVAVVQAVTGGPGVGKTQAAAAYARDRAAEEWPLVAWVTAETQEQLLTGLTKVASAVGVADADGDSTASARNLRRYLETCPGPALVVFDNATGVDELTAFLPTVGAAQVVITSTDRAFTRVGVPVEIGLFTPEQSVAYLKERTGLADADAAAAVAAELGHLPLALAQAATVISQQSLDYATYQRRLHQAPAAKYLTRHAGDPYPRGAVEAIALAIDNIEYHDDSGLTRMIMRLLSVLSTKGVDWSILAGLADVPIAPPSIAWAAPWDEAVDQAVGRLVGGSILTRSETGQTFSMHRLVSRVVRERDEADGQLLSTLGAAVDLLERLKVPDHEAWLRREAGSQLVEQVSAVWAVSSGRADADDPQFRDITERLMSLRNWSVRQLTDAVDLSRAISLGVTVLADCERLLGPDHPNTLTARANLATVYESAGRVREAIALAECNLADSERLLGPDHPNTLAARENLANTYKSAGRLRKAFSLRRQNATEAKRALEPGHPKWQYYRRNYWSYLLLAVIPAMASLVVVWLTGNYHIAIVVFLWFACMLLAPTPPAFQRFRAARDWRFLSFPWYEQLRYSIVSAIRQRIRRQ